MNIQPITYNNNTFTGRGKPKPKNFVNRIKQKIVDAVPSATFKDGEKTLACWQKFTNQLSKPDINRGVMGASAIILQPTIDAANKRVDHETRQVSICRTVAKIVVGTAVGMLVRGSAYKMVEKMTNPEGVRKFSKALLPTKFTQDLVKDANLMKNYRSALSTGIAILAMCVTNFALDAPLTVLLTNKLTKTMSLKNSKKSEEGTDEKRA